MKKWFLYISGVALFTTLFIVSCNKKDDDSGSSNGLDRKPMLEHYANNYIVPAYADMIQKLTALKTAIEIFNTTPNQANLANARAEWRNAYITWQKVNLLEFGPAEGATLRNFVNIHPVSTTKVNSNISSGSYDLNEFGNKDAQGFPALDYLLNGIDVDDNKILALYTSDINASNRKQYLQSVTNKLLDKVSAISSEWDSYKNTFINSTGTDVNSSTSIMINAYVLYYERYLRGGKIGLPVGAMTGFASPEITEAYYTPTLSKELALTALTSFRDFYTGKGYTSGSGSSLQSYLAAIGTTDENGTPIAQLIETELNEAIASLQNLNTTILDGVQNNRTEVLNIYQQIQDVVPLLKVDMVSAFSISITYTDNDGD